MAKSKKGINTEILRRILSRSTKIVATVGPATSRAEDIKKFVEMGVCIFRVNFSHGSYETNGRIIKNIRRVEKATGIPLTILQDLQGPKIRLGKFKKNPTVLKLGEEFILTTKEVLGDSKMASVTNEEIINDISVGDKIYLNDGLVKIEIVKIQDDKIYTHVIDGGEIGDHKGVNFPGTKLSTPAITEKDKKDLEFGLKIGVDCVALSFVRTANEVNDLRNLMGKKQTPIVSKIEKWEAIQNLPAILEASDVIMVARGDLGVELPIEEVPLIQKKIIKEAHAWKKPVITATQMLISMVDNPTPTRPEITDIANAIFDGTDAVMLSNETAVGNYPFKAVEVMDKIIQTTEKSSLFKTHIDEKESVVEKSVSSAVAYSATEIARITKAKLIVCVTEFGRTAMLIAGHRPAAPILSLTAQESTLKRLNFVWGAVPFKIKTFKLADQVFDFGQKIAKDLGIAKAHDFVVVTAGSKPGVTGGTNLIKVEEIL